MEGVHTSTGAVPESASGGADGSKVANAHHREPHFLPLGEPRVKCSQQCVTCTCCDRGGLFQLKRTVTITQDGVVQRYMLMIGVQGCCSNARTGLAARVPAELSPLLSQPAAERFLDELRDIGQLRSTQCCDCWRGLLLLLPCLWPWMSWRYRREVQRWNEALSDWQRRFNAEFLQPKGMAVKTQSHSRRVGKSRETERWISIAMNPVEAERLLVREPHVSGAMARGGCGTVDESTLVLHP